MVTTAIRYAPIAIKAAKVLHHLVRLYVESTPQEREDIKGHLRAILDVLRNAAMRSSDTEDLPALLMLPTPDMFEPASEFSDRPQKRIHAQSLQFRRNMRQIVRVIRRYASSLTAAEAQEVAEHLNEIWKILSQINRRVRN